MCVCLRLFFASNMACSSTSFVTHIFRSFAHSLALSTERLKMISFYTIHGATTTKSNDDDDDDESGEKD